MGKTPFNWSKYFKIGLFMAALSVSGQTAFSAEVSCPGVTAAMFKAGLVVFRMGVLVKTLDGKDILAVGDALTPHETLVKNLKEQYPGGRIRWMGELEILKGSKAVPLFIMRANETSGYYKIHKDEPDIANSVYDLREAATKYGWLMISLTNETSWQTYDPKHEHLDPVLKSANKFRHDVGGMLISLSEGMLSLYTAMRSTPPKLQYLSDAIEMLQEHLETLKDFTKIAGDEPPAVLAALRNVFEDINMVIESKGLRYPEESEFERNFQIISDLYERRRTGASIQLLDVSPRSSKP